MASKWIQKAIRRPGALRQALRVPEGKDIPAGKLQKAARAEGRLGRQARLAMTLRKLAARRKGSGPPAFQGKRRRTGPPVYRGG